MATHAAYPQTSDLGQDLSDMGLESLFADPRAMLNFLTRGDFVGSAITEFEEKTGFVPFLATASDTQYYDPQGPEDNHSGLTYAWKGGKRVLQLGTGYTSITQVMTGCVWDNGVVTDGTVRIPDLEYKLKPINAPVTNRPYEWIEFTTPLYGAMGSVAVTGTRGYLSAIPDLVWNAILGYAATLAFPKMAFLIAGAQTQRDPTR